MKKNEVNVGASKTVQFRGLNFINVLRTTFTLADPEKKLYHQVSISSTYSTDDLTVFFTLSGSTSVKVVRKMLMKLTL